MVSLQDRVLRLIHRERLIPESGRVIVALSGGADSVALTLLLRELQRECAFELTGVVHLNHRLRSAALEDEEFCRDLAHHLSLPIKVSSVDVAGVAAQEGMSIEEAGHCVRYAWFDEVADELVGQHIATAHTRNDQAETYLMRLIRGAGPEGLAGIRPRAGRVIRPLLDVSRQELRQYLAERGQLFKEDETNADQRVTRNRVRHALVPVLEEQFSPSIVDVLARTAAIARGDAEWIETAVNEVAPSVLIFKEDRALIDAVGLRNQPVALARRLARRGLEHVAQRSVGFDHVERLRAMASETPDNLQEADFPRCRVEREGSVLIVRPPCLRTSRPITADRFSYALWVPGEVQVQEAGLEISARRASESQLAGQLTARGGTVIVAARDLSPPLVVRGWQPGDTIRPLGLRGRKKLQDLFVDRKVLRSERHRVPIVADSKRGIVWVVGHTVADDFRVTDDAQGMLVLKARKLGGSGGSG